MEAIQSFDIDIKSIVHDYGVVFTDNYASSLKQLIQDGDYIIVDRKIVELYGTSLQPILGGASILSLMPLRNRRVIRV